MKKKKLLLTVLCVTMIVATAGCNKGSSSTNSKNESTTTSQSSQSAVSSEVVSSKETVSSEIVSSTPKMLSADISYYGDIKKCKMPTEIAQGYLEVLNRLPKEIKCKDSFTGTVTGNLKASLYDFSDDGYPIMMTYYKNDKAEDDFSVGIEDSDNEDTYVNFWHWTNGKVERLEFSSKEYHSYLLDHGYFISKCTLENKKYLYISIYNQIAPGMSGLAYVVTINNGTIEELHNYDTYNGFLDNSTDKTGKYCATIPESNALNDSGYYTKEELQSNFGGTFKGENWDLARLDGKEIPYGSLKIDLESPEVKYPTDSYEQLEKALKEYVD